MKRSNYFIPTLKEKPSDVNLASQEYMYRGGFIKKVSNGFFVYLPLFNRVMQKVNGKIRNAMESVSSVEVKFPILITKDTLEASGRWDAFGNEMFKLFDRHGLEFAISPTNEEAACFVADTFVKSYQDMPLSIYQIQQKHRDEISPRNGVMRAREFTMKDAYSFHTTEECLSTYYDAMGKAYIKVFNELGLDVVAVKADTGAMGGSGSQEIMAISPDGEDDVCHCPKCNYASNTEAVACVEPKGKAVATKGKFKKVHTPQCPTIEKLANFLKVEVSTICKSVVFKADGELVVALVRGDREVNDVKLKNLLGCNELELASASEVSKTGKTIPGYVGAVNLDGIKIIADNEVKHIKNMVVGANEKEYHLTGVGVNDFSKATEYADIRYVTAGEPCPECGAKMEFAKATELGHIFKLGKRYTDKLGLKFVNQTGGFETMTMGCYGIGVERTIASVIDQHHDDKGIIWPMGIAPFSVCLVTVDMANETQKAVSEKIYADLTASGVDVIWDDTTARPGSKFADCELIGYPLRITVGRGAVDSKVEFVERKNGEKQEFTVDEALKVTKEKFKAEK